MDSEVAQAQQQKQLPKRGCQNCYLLEKFLVTKFNAGQESQIRLRKEHCELEEQLAQRIREHEEQMQHAERVKNIMQEGFELERERHRCEIESLKARVLVHERDQRQLQNKIKEIEQEKENIQTRLETWSKDIYDYHHTELERLRQQYGQQYSRPLALGDNPETESEARQAISAATQAAIAAVFQDLPAAALKHVSLAQQMVTRFGLAEQEDIMAPLTAAREYYLAHSDSLAKQTLTLKKRKLKS